MKAIIFLLSFMFVSCVTANTETRELSGVNPEKETLAGEMLAHYDPCGDHTHNPSPRPRGFWGWLFGSLDDPYGDIIILNKEGVKVASYGDLNAFELLKESQSDVEEAPIQLAADYEDCMDSCRCDGGSSEGCHEVCK